MNTTFIIIHMCTVCAQNMHVCIKLWLKPTIVVGKTFQSSNWYVWFLWCWQLAGTTPSNCFVKCDARWCENLIHWYVLLYLELLKFDCYHLMLQLSSFTSPSYEFIFKSWNVCPICVSEIELYPKCEWNAILSEQMNEFLFCLIKFISKYKKDHTRKTTRETKRWKHWICKDFSNVISTTNWMKKSDNNKQDAIWGK